MNIIPKAYAAIENPIVKYATPGQTDAGFAYYFGQVWKTAVIVGGLAFLLYLVLGGLNWVTAGGDKGKVEKAQQHITNALVGLTVLVGSYAIVVFIREVFGIDFLNINWKF